MFRSLLVLVIILTTFNADAQTSNDNIKQKRYVHHVGVQINELIRQVFNFNGNAANTNPYLLTYNINSTRSGWGIRAGAGYIFQSKTDDDGINRRTSDLNDFTGRLGFEKMFNLSAKWSAGAGLDGVVIHNDDFTRSVVRSFDTVTTVVNSKITSFGGGPMFWLRYNISGKVLIGTETSIYFTSGQENSSVSISRRQFSGSGNIQVTKTTTVDNLRMEARIATPVAFFLIVRF